MTCPFNSLPVTTATSRALLFSITYTTCLPSRVMMASLGAVTIRSGAALFCSLFFRLQEGHIATHLRLDQAVLVEDRNLHRHRRLGAVGRWNHLPQHALVGLVRNRLHRDVRRVSLHSVGPTFASLTSTSASSEFMSAMATIAPEDVEMFTPGGIGATLSPTSAIFFTTTPSNGARISVKSSSPLASAGPPCPVRCRLGQVALSSWPRRARPATPPSP